MTPAGCWQGDLTPVSAKKRVKLSNCLISVRSLVHFLSFCVSIRSCARGLAEWILRPGLFHGDHGVMGSDGGNGQSTVNLLTLDLYVHEMRV